MIVQRPARIWKISRTEYTFKEGYFTPSQEIHVKQGIADFFATNGVSNVSVSQIGPPDEHSLIIFPVSISQK